MILKTNCYVKNSKIRRPLKYKHWTAIYLEYFFLCLSTVTWISINLVLKENVGIEFPWGCICFRALNSKTLENFVDSKILTVIFFTIGWFLEPFLLILLVEVLRSLFENLFLFFTLLASFCTVDTANKVYQNLMIWHICSYLNDIVSYKKNKRYPYL